MPKSVTKIALSSSRDIPFNRLVLSQANVRRIKAGASIEAWSWKWFWLMLVACGALTMLIQAFVYLLG